MSAFVITVLRKRPHQWSSPIKAGPRGRFKVGESKYDFYGNFIVYPAHSRYEGYSWTNATFSKFWYWLNEIEKDYQKLKDFKP
jgi:hypothetical protein